MPRDQKISALVVILAAVLGLTYTVVAGNQPLLGLDLQGGVSVVLQPTEPADDEALDQAIEIIRNRVDALGVAEPEISRQGSNIVVDLPGVQEQQRALDLVGQTAELRFRPVIATVAPTLPGTGEAPADSAPTTEAPATPDPDTPEGTTPPADRDGATTPDAGATGEGGPDATPSTTVAPGGDEQSLPLPLPAGRFGRMAPAQADPGTTTTAPAPEGGAPTDPVDPAPGDAPADDPDPGGAPAEPTPAQQAAAEACFGGGAVATPSEEDRAENHVLLPDADGTLYCLGPTLLTGDAIETANAFPLGLGEWQVNPVFKGGSEGIDRFNAAAEVCFGGDPDLCPTRALAIVLDHRVVVAPQINGATFQRDQIQITGGFDQDEAQDVALVLRYGALPVELEAQQTRTVSATIGEDALTAGLIAGIVGLVLVALYLMLYYRLAALVVIGGLAVSGALLWTIIAWFGETQGLALTTAGIVGIIVSIGVSVDSNIVYFENVRESIRDGRTMRTAIERAYRSSISTIVKADVVALLAAGLLYWLTVGAVRGFAFYLGLATLLDLIVAWFFMRPALNWLARSRLGGNSPARLGVAAPAARAEGAT